MGGNKARRKYRDGRQGGVVIPALLVPFTKKKAGTPGTLSTAEQTGVSQHVLPFLPVGSRLIRPPASCEECKLTPPYGTETPMLVLRNLVSSAKQGIVVV